MKEKEERLNKLDKIQQEQVSKIKDKAKKNRKPIQDTQKQNVIDIA